MHGKTVVKMGRGMSDLYMDRHDLAGLQGLGSCNEQDKGEWDKLQFLVLWVSTFQDCVTYVILLQGASWVTQAERIGGYVKF